MVYVLLLAFVFRQSFWHIWFILLSYNLSAYWLWLSSLWLTVLFFLYLWLHIFLQSPHTGLH